VAVDRILGELGEAAKECVARIWNLVTASRCPI
jgi:hypothetical protein